jgi:hypothetical protein
MSNGLEERIEGSCKSTADSTRFPSHNSRRPRRFLSDFLVLHAPTEFLFFLGSYVVHETRPQEMGRWRCTRTVTRTYARQSARCRRGPSRRLIDKRHEIAGEASRILPVEAMSRILVRKEARARNRREQPVLRGTSCVSILVAPYEQRRLLRTITSSRSAVRGGLHDHATYRHGYSARRLCTCRRKTGRRKARQRVCFATPRRIRPDSETRRARVMVSRAFGVSNESAIRSVPCGWVNTGRLIGSNPLRGVLTTSNGVRAAAREATSSARAPSAPRTS